MAGIRSFVALDLPGSVKQALGDLIAAMSRENAGVRWVRAEAIHLTLKFLGDVDESRLGDVSAVVDRAAAAVGPVPLSLDAVGAFPDTRRARVIWAGLAGETGALAALQAAVDAGLAEAGFEPERRPFLPHLTLGRRRAPGPVDASTVVPRTSFTCDRLTLFRSDLGPGGARYTALHEAGLRGG